ncbi:MAG: dihydrolipoyl dehydrogenase [Anaplasmataceae bacterium]|nr:dihydrolipoyl dehydrogenase [Anaplasmataceae bacterium]
MNSERFDIAIIGAGPGGYVSAIKAAQTGKKVALIDKGPLGGTCLNVGCIPTKTLLAGAEILHKIKLAEDFGITTGSISFDYAKMKARKDSVIDSIRKSLGGLLLANQIKIFRGTAEFISPQELKIKGEDNLHIFSEKIIIASGSEPTDIKAFPCDHKKIYNSTSILEMTALPKTLGVIGGGYIGCEFASLYADLGVKVIILEALPSIVSLQGKAIAEALTKGFVKKGIDIRTNVIVEGIDETGDGLSIRLKGGDTVLCDRALVSIGRRIVSKELNLNASGVLTDERGTILVDDTMQTNVPGIYAIGDVTGKAMLAHVASHQGIVAAVNCCGGHAVMHYDAIPAVIFTNPEIATIGMTQEQALEAGFQISIGKFPFQALGKSIASRETEGFSQIVSEKKTGRILGAQVVGHEASVLIAEMALAMANEITIEALSDTIHAHPTVSEAWLEAALLAAETPIHFPPKIRKANV